MNTKSDQNLITALYCRLSQEDMREGESLSIENQKLILQKYANDNGFRNCQFYIDDGFSGVDKTRPEYVRMLQDVENGLVGTVIVKDQSRLGRDHLETDRLMELTFPAYDIRFIAVTDGVDSANGVNEMSGIRNLFNDFYHPFPKTYSNPLISQYPPAIYNSIERKIRVHNLCIRILPCSVT